MTSPDVQIQSDGPSRQLSVDLVGANYKLTPPKAGIALRIARLVSSKDPEAQAKSMDLLDVWMKRAFGAKFPEIERRLYEDPDDELDIMHIIQLIQRVIEVQTGNPTS